MLKDQITTYILEQRIQHLLAKLKLELCTDIITYYKVLSKRNDLVLLTIRLELAKYKTSSSSSSSSSSQSTYKHNISKVQKSYSKKKRYLSPNYLIAILEQSKSNANNITYQTYNKKSYYTTNYSKKGKSKKTTTRKITISVKKAKTKKSLLKADK